jgi:hypothetical protein
VKATANSATRDLALSDKDQRFIVHLRIDTQIIGRLSIGADNNQ